MLLFRLSRLAISTISIVICHFSLHAETDVVVEPITELGARASPNGQFKVVLRQNSMGGATDLFVMKNCEPIFYAADVTGYLWVGNALVYSSTPLYGSAGIYRYDPIMEMRSSLVDGKENEYFELRCFSPNTKKLDYYYSDDIRHLDIMKLKASKEAVREIPIPNDA
jgi:hypothetical protein